MFPPITFVSVTDQLTLIWANNLLQVLFAVGVAFALLPRIIRAMKSVLGGRR
jgi:hypothetical protein